MNHDSRSVQRVLFSFCIVIGTLFAVFSVTHADLTRVESRGYLGICIGVIATSLIHHLVFIWQSRAKVERFPAAQTNE
jgi:hypothetical protein